jgi:hypothetical protein
MRLSLSINGVSRLVAAVSGSGYLGGYLNLHERPKDNDYSKSIRLSGTQTLDTETIRFEWPTFDLKTGDAVEIRVLDDGEGDAPKCGGHLNRPRIFSPISNRRNCSRWSRILNRG